MVYSKQTINGVFHIIITVNLCEETQKQQSEGSYRFTALKKGGGNFVWEYSNKPGFIANLLSSDRKILFCICNRIYFKV